jgi:hypothetical protein
VNFWVSFAADFVVFWLFLGDSGDGAGVKEKCCAGPGDLLTAGEGRGAYGGTMVLQWCYNGVTMVLLSCYRGISVVFQWRNSGVTVVL